MFIQDWIGNKLKEIAVRLPTLSHTEPASFSCGYNVGYKQALLDLENIVVNSAEASLCKCNDIYTAKENS